MTPDRPIAELTQTEVDLIAARARRHAPRVPDGWVLVPKEPTDAMCQAMLDRIEDAESGRGAPFDWPDIEHMFDVYVDAIAATSPAVTSTERGEDK